MLFYSFEFLLLFLPLVCVGFFWIARYSPRVAAAWLALSSLVFYGYWNPRFVLLILVSVTINFLVARRMVERGAGSGAARRLLLIGVSFNLALLAYFKYTNFFISTANTAFGTDWATMQILLPLGISVFTFTQIAFLSDVHRGLAREYRYLNYLLFVAYFPHLIAGPIIHHRQMMPQFEDPANYQVRAENFAIGLVIFLIGLAKKVLLAGSFAEYVDPVFEGAERGLAPGFAVAWIGALAYTLQIYFDFSGYSDMAIGLSRLFGIRLPENFNSPYKAHNIIEFWRRWNMTLSQFLRDYLYIPLGGNRRGPVRRYLNLAITMLLGGLWHGASWTYVAWGGLHAIYLSVNHGWIELMRRLRLPKLPWLRFFATGLTFVAVLAAWVVFRADSLESAGRILSGLTDLRNASELLHLSGADFDDLFNAYWVPHDTAFYRGGILAVGLGLVWLAPNTRELIERAPLVGPSAVFATIGACCFWVILLATISASRQLSQFIYFNF
jgi:alginate O-acetyltransferase complex protein AlgI